MKKAVFPGSFDPLTLGHCDIINKSLDLFDEIVLAIGVNSTKENMFSIDQRKKFIHDEFINEEKIAKRIKNNQDLFDRNIKYKKIEIDESFPKYIFNNKAMFKEWII